MWTLFKSFFKIGCITIGGGYAMIPILEDVFVKKLKWLTTQELIEVTSLSQIIPGPLATTLAAFIGKRQFGTIGAFVSTVSILFPSFLIMLIMSAFFSTSFDNPIMMKSMHGARLAIIAIIAHTVSRLFKRFQDMYTFIFFFASLIALIMGANPIIVIGIGGIFGGLFYWSFYVVYFTKNQFKKKDEDQ